jgi:soluble lytic murein transglycosylase
MIFSSRFAFLSRLLCLLIGVLTIATLSRAQTPVVAQESEPPSLTPLPPTPTPSPPDFELAQAFARQGEVDAAIGVFTAVIERGDAPERLPARLELSKLLLDDGQYPAAERQLDAYLLEAPSGAGVRDAQFLLAEALSAQSKGADAAPLFEAYARDGGPASVYARMGRAQSLAWLGDADALVEGESVLATELPHAVRLAFINGMAQALETSFPDEAIRWYERLRRESDNSNDDAHALWRAAQVAGDLSARFAAWDTIIRRYPDTPTAWAIVDDMPPVKIVLGSDYAYRFGLVYYRAGRTADARQAFLDSLGANGEGEIAARASFYLGVLEENAGNAAAAFFRYRRVVELDPAVDLADDALWWQGRVLERQGRRSEAEAAYQRLIDEYPGSGWASEARFRLGLLRYDAGDWAEAAAWFETLAGSSGGLDAQRALLWQGKALAASGDDDAAEAVWSELVGEAPDDFYGLRAAVLLGDGEGGVRDAGIDDEEELDWEAIESWLRDARGGDPLAAQVSLSGNAHWAAGQALLALGMERRAGAELAQALDQASGDAQLLYQLLRGSSNLGLTPVSSQAAARLLKNVPKDVAEAAPEDLWRLAYPAPFTGALRDAADAHDVPDVLLLAMVRQESFFDPRAGSPAGAIGLTQVIPSTGAAIAEELELADFQPDDLFQPALSLRFGARYLREQLETFDGNVYQALAAYNAGPGNVLRWAGAAGDDVDRFVAEIEFEQTETYVRLVAENLARYRQVYQGFDRPVLPED